jgi:acyl-CoA thioesterase
MHTSPDEGPGSPEDRFATALGVRVVSADVGYAVAEILVEEHHLNDRRIAHGGVLFALADIALSVASNPPGDVALVPSATVYFLRPATLGSRLTAEARVEHRGRTLSLYSVSITSEGKLIARLEGQTFSIRLEKQREDAGLTTSLPCQGPSPGRAVPSSS